MEQAFRMCSESLNRSGDYYSLHSPILDLHADKAKTRHEKASTTKAKQPSLFSPTPRFLKHHFVHKSH